VVSRSVANVVALNATTCTRPRSSEEAGAGLGIADFSCLHRRWQRAHVLKATACAIESPLTMKPLHTRSHVQM